MTELQVFDGALAEQVYVIATMVCVAVFFGVALLWRPARAHPYAAALRG